MPQWDVWQWLVLAMLALLCVLTVALLVSHAKKKKDITLEEGLRTLQNSLSEDNMHQREDLMRSLQSLNEGLSGILNRSAEQQVIQYEAQDSGRRVCTTLHRRA